MDIKDIIDKLNNDDERATGILELTDLFNNYNVMINDKDNEINNLKTSNDKLRESNSKLLLRVTEKYNIENETHPEPELTPEQELNSILQIIGE